MLERPVLGNVPTGLSDDDRELTYFGEAFLKDSIPKARTVEEAFRKSATLIEQRETREHKTRSNPQMSVGAQMHDKLTGLEGRAVHPPGPVTTVLNR